MSKLIVLDEQTKEFIALLHRGGTHRFTQRMGKYTESAWSRVDEVLRILPQDKGDAIYFGVNPTTIRITPEDQEKYAGKPSAYIEPRIASKEKTVACINCVYREYDAKDFTGAEKKADKEAIFRTNPDHYRGLAFAHVRNLNPQPSVVVASGGGYNCYWLLDETFFIRTDEDRAFISDLQKRWVHMDKAADQGVCDLRRVFRIPGTINYKEIYAPHYPTVSFVKYTPTETQSVRALSSYLPAMESSCPSTSRSTSHIQPKAHAVPFAGESVIDAFNRTHTITDLMTAYGYTKSYGDKWNRPDTKNRGIQLHNDNTIYTHSDGGKLQGKRLYTAFGLYCVHEHGGDAKAAVKQAAADMGMVRKPVAEEKKTDQPSFADYVRGLRQWIVTADLESVIPSHLHSANGYKTGDNDRKAFDTLIDIFERYGKFNGPISYNQGNLISGMSNNTFRDCLKRWLETCLLRRHEPDTKGGAYWYTLDTDTCVLRRVGIVIKALPTPAKYASVYSQEKGEDAWQLRGSKVQKEKALIKALGPAALHVVANLVAGERTHQAAIAGRTHKNASAISRILKRLEDCNVVETEKVGRQKFVTLLPDWKERVQEYTPYMPTFGNKDRREFNAETRLVEHCDRQLAKGIGDTEKLLSKREQAMRSLAVRMERDLSGIDFDTQSEKMRRLLRMDNLQRNATIAGKARKHQAKPWMDLGKETARMRTIRQTTEDNETLLWARQQESGSWTEQI